MNLTNYSQFKMQDYLTDPNTDVETKKAVFRWRTFMEDFLQNYCSRTVDTLCPLCGIHADTEQLCFSTCKVIKQNVNVQGNYEDIFSETVNSKVASSLYLISQIRKQMRGQL